MRTKTETTRKLILNRESLRQLDGRQLTAVVAGQGVDKGTRATFAATCKHCH